MANKVLAVYMPCISLKSNYPKTAPALKAILALGLVILIAELAFRRWLGPALGKAVQNMADFTIWLQMLILGFLFSLCMILTALGLYTYIDRRKLDGFGFSFDHNARTIALAGLAVMLVDFGI